MTSGEWLLVGVGVLSVASASCSGGASATTSGTGGTTAASSSTSSTGTGGSTTTSSSTSGTGTGGSTTTSSSTSSTGTGGSTTTSSSTSGTGTGGSGAVDAGSDAGDGMVSTVYPAPHPAPPQVIYAGGPVLASPELVPVFFSGEDPTRQAQLTDFVSKIGATQYWTATTSEYGVGPATSASPVVLTETAPATIDDSAIQTWLAGKLDANDPAWPAANNNTLYLLHYPAGTTITEGSAQSCVSFGSYHGDITLDAAHGGLHVAYAVVPGCPFFDALNGINAATGAASQAIIDAVTNPYPTVDPAYGQVDNDHLYWELALGGGEVSSLCAQFPGVFTKPTGFSYTVQRTWSNAAAAAGHDPCVPEPSGEVYFNTAPVLTETVTVAGLSPMKGVDIPVGQSKTIELDLFSEGDTGGPWAVGVVDYNVLLGQTPALEFILDYTTGQNGQKQHLTITRSSAGTNGVSFFLLTSQYQGHQFEWVGLVGD